MCCVFSCFLVPAENRSWCSWQRLHFPQYFIILFLFLATVAAWAAGLCVSSPLWSRLKHANNYLRDCHESLHTHLWWGKKTLEALLSIKLFFTLQVLLAFLLLQFLWHFCFWVKSLYCHFIDSDEIWHTHLRTPQGELYKINLVIRIRFFGDFLSSMTIKSKCLWLLQNTCKMKDIPTRFTVVCFVLISGFS